MSQLLERIVETQTVEAPSLLDSLVVGEAKPRVDPLQKRVAALEQMVYALREQMESQRRYYEKQRYYEDRANPSPSERYYMERRRGMTAKSVCPICGDPRCTYPHDTVSDTPKPPWL